MNQQSACSRSGREGGKDGAGGRGGGQGRSSEWGMAGRVQVAPKQQEKRGVRGGRVEQAGKIKGGRAGGGK